MQGLKLSVEYIHPVKIQNIVMQDPFWNGTFNMVKLKFIPYRNRAGSNAGDMSVWVRY